MDASHGFHTKHDREWNRPSAHIDEFVDGTGAIPKKLRREAQCASEPTPCAYCSSFGAKIGSRLIVLA